MLCSVSSSSLSMIISTTDNRCNQCMRLCSIASLTWYGSVRLRYIWPMSGHISRPMTKIDISGPMTEIDPYPTQIDTPLFSKSDSALVYWPDASIQLFSHKKTDTLICFLRWARFKMIVLVLSKDFDAAHCSALGEKEPKNQKILLSPLGHRIKVGWMRNQNWLSGAGLPAHQGII